MAARKPLSGKTVIDCATLMPGPSLAQKLRGLGARVIRIENPDQPDGVKALGRTFYRELNRGKQIIKLNLKEPADRKRFSTLVKKADAVIEAFRPAAKRKLGLDQRSLHRINPRLIILSITGYPERGALKDRAGHDINFQARTGLLSLSRELPGLPLGDFFTVDAAAIRFLAQLRLTEKSRRGARVVVNFYDTLREVQHYFAREYAGTGHLPAPDTTLFTGAFPCYRIYRCRDGRRVTVGAVEQKFWEKLCEVLELNELRGQGYARGSEAAQVIELVQAAFGRRDWSDWAPYFEAANCCVEPVLDYSEVFG
ncbi:MAG: CaiB/BaiF CoA transferase family protein [Bacteriovoracia bacterium]